MSWTNVHFFLPILDSLSNPLQCLSFYLFFRQVLPAWYTKNTCIYKFPDTHIYMHTSIHTYTYHTYINLYIHLYIPHTGKHALMSILHTSHIHIHTKHTHYTRTCISTHTYSNQKVYQGKALSPRNLVSSLKATVFPTFFRANLYLQRCMHSTT